MKRIGVVLVVCLCAPSVFACVTIYVNVGLYAGAMSQWDGLWSDATVQCRDYFGNLWASYMYLEHSINRAGSGPVEGRLHSGFAAVWSSTLFHAVTTVGHCYRGYAQGDDNLGTMQGAGTAQICYSGPVLVNCENDPTHPDCIGDRCERNPEGPGCGGRENSPLIVNTSGGAWRLSGPQDSVWFDIDADGEVDRITWTSSGSSLEFLAVDKNRNGIIDDGRELFGSAHRLQDGSIAHNGFIALAEYDSNGDGHVNQNDSAWCDLLLWNDRDHDGISTQTEMRNLRDSEIVTLETSYVNTGRKDRHGNEFRMMSHLSLPDSRRPYFDVYFVRSR